MDKDVLRPEGSCFSVPKMGLNSEIPRVVHDSPRPCVGQFIGLVCCYV